MNETPPVPDGWVRRLGYGTAIGFATLWTTAAIVFSDAILIAAFGVGGLAFVVTIFAFVIRVPHAGRIAVAVLGSALFCVGVAGVRHLKQGIAFINHDTNMSRVTALGMGGYYNKNEERLPPAAHYGPDGKPLLSWRVLILPYLDERGLYSEFRLNEPWDSPHNLQLLPRMPKAYRSLLPTGTRDPPHTTRIQVMAGRGTAFDGVEGLHYPKDFPDGRGLTLLILEGRNPVPWTKPEDISYDPNGPLPQIGVEVPHSLCGWVFGSGRPVGVMWKSDVSSSSPYRIDSTWTEDDIRKAIERNNGVPVRR